MKKTISIILATIMLLTLCACRGGGGYTDLSAESLNDPLTKDDVISFLVSSSAAIPVREDWKLWEYMEEG
ncbi:MAG: hypothetical protein IJ949_06970, partial [Oscillospiraceae bacterium]|nr:hypothetical protein [Oscillospiraceae bacterium]